MRIFSVLGLLVVVAIVGLLAKKNLGTATAPVALPAPAGAASAPAAPANVQQQSQQAQRQFQQALDGALQQARPMPDEK